MQLLNAGSTNSSVQCSCCSSPITLTYNANCSATWPRYSASCLDLWISILLVLRPTPQRHTTAEDSELKRPSPKHNSHLRVSHPYSLAVCLRLACAPATFCSPAY